MEASDRYNSGLDCGLWMSERNVEDKSGGDEEGTLGPQAKTSLSLRSIGTCTAPRAWPKLAASHCTPPHTSSCNSLLCILSATASRPLLMHN